MSFFNKQISRNQKIFLSLIFVIIILIGITGILRPTTLHPTHLIETARQSVPLGITTIGQTVVILSGGIDLSVGELITMTNILAVDMLRGRDSRNLPVISFLICLGALIGGISGYLIARTSIPPMVMTFAMSSMIKGGYLLYSGGAPKGRASNFLRFISSKRIGIIPVSIIIYILILAAAIYIFRKTKWGRSVFYIGNNKKAALYTGIPINYRLVLIYSFSAVMAVIAGLILSGYIGVGNFDIGGDAYMLNSIAASVVGGNTFNGIGSIGGSALGALIITVMSSVLTSLGIAETGKLVMRGLIILVMVTIYMRQTEGFNILRRLGGISKNETA